MIKKVLFVEDGSVDTDDIEERFPDIPIIIYRQGAPKPEFIDVEMPEANDLYTVKQIKDCVSKVLRRLPRTSDYDLALARDVVCVRFDENIDIFLDDIEKELKSGADPSGDN